MKVLSKGRRVVLELSERLAGAKAIVREGPPCRESPAWRIGRPERIRKDLGWEPERSDLTEIISTQWEFLQKSSEQAGSETAELFGEVAIKLGFVTREDVQKALQIQRADVKSGRPRRLLGLILLEEGLIDNFQLIEILKYYERKSVKKKEGVCRRRGF